MEKQLLEYVEQESKRGVSQHLIKKALRDAGWDDPSIEEAFARVQSKYIPPSPRMEPPQEEEIIFEDEEEPVPDLQKPKKGFKPMLVVITLVLAAAAAFFFFNNGSEVHPNTAPQDNLFSAGNATTTAGNKKDLAGAPATSTDAQYATTTGNSTTTAAAGGASATSTDAQEGAIAARNSQRMKDMQKLGETQKAWFTANGKYYTCGLAGGDCKGKPYGYPSQIGTLLSVTPSDPLGVTPAQPKTACGNDYVYCGLNNAPYPQFYCYYAKLEGGGFYTASHAGNFLRATAPKIFEECAVAN